MCNYILFIGFTVLLCFAPLFGRVSIFTWASIEKKAVGTRLSAELSTDHEQHMYTKTELFTFTNHNSKLQIRIENEIENQI